MQLIEAGAFGKFNADSTHAPAVLVAVYDMPLGEAPAAADATAWGAACKDSQANGRVQLDRALEVLAHNPNVFPLSPTFRSGYIRAITENSELFPRPAALHPGILPDFLAGLRAAAQNRTTADGLRNFNVLFHCLHLQLNAQARGGAARQSYKLGIEGLAKSARNGMRRTLEAQRHTAAKSVAVSAARARARPHVRVGA